MHKYTYIGVGVREVFCDLLDTVTALLPSRIGAVWNSSLTTTIDNKIRTFEAG